MYNIPLVTSSSVVPLIGFWNSILLYHDRPHVVNRKLAGVSQAPIYRVSFHSDCIKKLRELFSRSGILYEVRKLNDLTREFLNEEFVRSFIEPYDKNACLDEVTTEQLKEAADGVFISLRVLLPRYKLCNRCVEIVILDKDRNEVVFFAVTDSSMTLAPNFPYTFELATTGHLRLCVDTIEDADTSSAEWLSFALFQKVFKWAEEAQSSSTIVTSLSLISAGDYIELYQNLKFKYAEKIIKIWPENTDPQKFVFEDVAIASYLICLWSKIDHDKKQSFVDLGCGNGLLVYILVEEGYPGFGVDVRARKIWDLYPKHVRLEVQTLTPDSTAFPDTDWIIGNHSDELTLWIPVVAVKSSPKTNFFLLPCCAYDFNGHKYKRLDSSRSQYSEYLDHVKNVSTKCGYKVEIDKLRIPSTKRTCLIGYERSYQECEYNLVTKNVIDYVESVLANTKQSTLRSPVEQVRNCTKVDKDIVKKIIKKCVDLLLEEENILIKVDGQNWNKGGALEFSVLPDHITPGDLKKLKNECGGLQTLLKNHRYLFVVKNGTFSLREPLAFASVNNKYRDKPCWFQINHPNGCLHDKEKCAYKHCDVSK